MNIKMFQRCCDLAAMLLLIGVGLWLRVAIPHVRAVLNDPNGSDLDLMPHWFPIPMFIGLILFHSTWVLEKYFNYRIRKAQERHSFSQSWMASIKKTPKQFQPEERVEAIDTYFISQLELRKAEAKGWLSAVSAHIFCIASILATFTFWPLLYMMFGALLGIVK
jgi:hypothetical protein